MCAALASSGLTDFPCKKAAPIYLGDRCTTAVQGHPCTLLTFLLLLTCWKTLLLRWAGIYNFQKSTCLIQFPHSFPSENGGTLLSISYRLCFLHILSLISGDLFLYRVSIRIWSIDYQTDIYDNCRQCYGLLMMLAPQKLYYNRYLLKRLVTITWKNMLTILCCDYQ